MSSQITILKNRIDCVPGFDQLYRQMKQFVAGSGKPGYITVNNVHTMMEGYHHDTYRSIINDSFLSIPDGKPLEIFGKLKGNKEITRLFGPTVMEKCIDWGRQDGIKHFFLGSSQQTLDKLVQSIEEKYPGTQIAGLLSPPYAPVSEWNNQSFIEHINQSGADFIWIGLGAPKQEIWMSSHFDQLHKGIMIGIGAGFDYLAGNTQHAPNWMKNASLEWLYRFIQEPKRLWKRYFLTIPPFLVLATYELLLKRTRPTKP
jgi:N-acetylglucosaminyldiphosphoundecaprenol N-acetyl-beta-D-mannosaminyltransferase